MRNSSIVVLTLLLILFSCVSDPVVQDVDIEEAPVIENDIPVDQGPVKSSVELKVLPLQIATDMGSANTVFTFMDTIYATSYSVEAQEMTFHKGSNFDDELVAFQTIKIDSPQSVYPFSFQESQFLLITQSEGDHYLYRMNEDQLEEFQVFEKAAFHEDSHFTQYQNNLFLIMANTYDEYGYDLDSSIYKFSEVAFRPYQSIHSIAASSLDTATFNDTLWLLVSGNNDESSIQLYQFDETSFIESVSIENTSILLSKLYVSDNTLKFISADKNSLSGYNWNAETIEQDFTLSINNIIDFTFHRSQDGASFVVVLTDASIQVYQFEDGSLNQILSESYKGSNPQRIISIPETNSLAVISEEIIQFVELK